MYIIRRKCTGTNFEQLYINNEFTEATFEQNHKSLFLENPNLKFWFYRCYPKTFSNKNYYDSLNYSALRRRRTLFEKLH